MDAIETARSFVEENFPEARAAIVAGSFVRGDATATSDLDLVIIADGEEVPFRASYRYIGWPIEVFVHDEESYPRYFDLERGRPSLAMMIAEGVVIRDRDGSAQRAQATARAALEKGPEALTVEQLDDRRYGLTDLLDDFIGCDRFDEGMFIAHDLAVDAANLLLLLHRRWRGAGKWVPRALSQHDPEAAERLNAALQAYYRDQDKEPLVRFADEVLARVGGRLWEGYYRKGTR